MLRRGNIFFDDPLKIRVIAKDPSNKIVSDILEIEVAYSFIFVLERIMYFAGPIIGILGMIKY